MNNKPMEFIKCSFCYATGYRITTRGVTGIGGEASARITNRKCFHCNGAGYISENE
jgi:hypothetical protein